MFRTHRAILPLLVIIVAFPFAASAQVATGTPSFGSFGGGPDIINLANLNAHWTIPALNKPGRGTNFTYDLSYDTSLWYPVTAGSTSSWQPVYNWGWRGATEVATGYVSYSAVPASCRYFDPIRKVYWTVYYENYSNYVYHDAYGRFHPYTFTTSQGQPNCHIAGYGATGVATDGSGLTMTVPIPGNSTTATVTTTAGTVFNPPMSFGTGSGNFTDRNGNEVTADGTGKIYDTLSSTTPVLTVTGTGTPTDPMVFTYTAPSGPTASYTMKYSTYTVQTSFGCGISEYGPTSISLVNEIDLPDNSKYTFAYEQTPGVPANVTGRLKSVTLPTGGTITYNYTGGNNGINCSDGSAATLTRTTPDGTWTYAQAKGTGAASTTTITDPQNNQTVIQFQGLYETQRQVYQGSTSGTLLKTINSCYNGNTTNCTTTAVTLPITRRTETIQLGSLQCKHDRFWNSFGMLTEADDYDYASSTPPLLRQTLITYASLGSNLNAFTQTVTVKDGSGTIKSRQDTNYDQYSSFSGANCITGAPQHDDSGHGCSFTARANATSITTYTNPAGPSGGITQNFTYDSLGNLRTAQDALTNTTTLAYSPDAWANTACPPSATTYAFPVSASNALSQTTSFTYFACTGQLASAKDPNNQTTSFSYDSLLRPTQGNFPDGGQTTATYNSPTSITTTTKMNSSQNITSTLLLDGLGRTSQTQLSDPQGTDYAVTTYDVVGRVASVSNPYRSTSDPTYGLTSYQYDALSRPTLVIPPDGTSSANNISANYSGNTTTVTDQAGKKRQTTIDALGRLTQVTEDPGGLGYVTTYTYDALSNLTGVTQNGGRQRTVTYDALSRLVCESNPEIQIATCPNPDNGSYTTGTIRYGYDNNSNLTSRQAPAPNQAGSATVTTTYTYDALNRLTQKSYSDGTTPMAGFVYDRDTGWGAQNLVGRLLYYSNATTATVSSYDAMGRVTFQYQCVPPNCNSAFRTDYSYNYLGGATSYTNGMGVTFTQSFDSAGRVSGLTSSLVDSQHPATLFTADSSVGYYPHGALRKMTYGNGLTGTTAFNNAFQPCRISLNSSATALSTCTDAVPSGNLLDFAYGFNAGSANNGNVASWSAAGQQAFSRLSIGPTPMIR